MHRQWYKSVTSCMCAMSWAVEESKHAILLLYGRLLDSMVFGVRAPPTAESRGFCGRRIGYRNLAVLPNLDRMSVSAECQGAAGTG